MNFVSLSLFCALKYIFLRKGPYVSPDFQRGPWHKKSLRTPDLKTKLKLDELLRTAAERGIFLMSKALVHNFAF